MLKFLHAFLVGRDLYPFEKAILIEVVARVDEEARVRLQRQIDVINKVQRISEGKEVNLYQMRNGRVAFDDSLRFPNSPPELLLASANLELPGRKEKLRVKVWMAEGRLFSLEFNRTPQHFFSEINLRDARPEIVDVGIHCDPK